MSDSHATEVATLVLVTFLNVDYYKFKFDVRFSGTIKRSVVTRLTVFNNAHE